MESSTVRLMELLCVHLYVPRWLMLLLYTLKRVGYKVVYLTTGGMLMISLFFHLTKTFRSLTKSSKWSTCYHVIHN